MRLCGGLLLFAAALCAFGSFGVGYATYVHDEVARSAAFWSVPVGLVVFPLLWGAWRLLGRRRTVEVLVLGVLNLAQLVPTIQRMIYILRNPT
ncbi:MAG: hypothetical protein ACM3VT_12355 [Solirubrobacterales bacterium]